MDTPGDAYLILADALRTAQEAAATLSHLSGFQGDAKKTENWLLISEHFKLMQHNVRLLHVGRVRG